MSTPILVSEVLYYVQNNVHNHPRGLLVSAVNGFYTDEEVTVAKKCLYSAIEKLKPDGLQRCTKRNPGDAKRKLECEDIMNLFSFADERQLVLPTFVSANFERVPTVAPGDVDVYSLAASVSALTAQLESLSKRLESTVSRREVDAIDRRLDSIEAGRTTWMTENFPPLMSTEPVLQENKDQQDAGFAGSFARCFRTKDEGGVWFTVEKKKAMSVPPRRILGGHGSQSDKLKAVPANGPKLWHVFVGRLVPDTSEEDLSDFLNEAGIEVHRCSLLKPKEEWQKKYAAFRVQISIKDKDNVFDKVQWPAGADLRDWVFNSKE